GGLRQRGPCVNTADGESIHVRGVWIDIRLWFATTCEIAIRKCAQHFAPSTANIFAETVVGNEIADVRVAYQHHVAMEVNGVAAVSDDPLAVHRVFHKRESQSVDHRVQFKLATLHLSHRLRFQDRDTIDGSIL